MEERDRTREPGAALGGPSRWPARVLVAIVLAGAALAAVSWSRGGLAATLLDPDLDMAARVSALRQQFLGYGAWAPAAYVAFVTIEVVVAPIPGTVLYAPGGVIFGGLWGGSLSLLGNVLGAGIAFLLTRSLVGPAWIETLADPRLRRYERRLAEQGFWVIFLLRVNPLTSSDVVSYAAGLTSIAPWKLLLGTLAGMAPLCYAQAYLADSLITAYPGLLPPLVVLGAAYVVWATWALWAVSRRERRTP